MISAASHILLVAALRALIVALALYAGLRALRVANAPALKAAWTMVLGAAMAMPLLMHWQPRPSWTAVKVHPISWSKWVAFKSRAQRPSRASIVSTLQEPATTTRQASEAINDFATPAETYSNLDSSQNTPTTATSSRATDTAPPLSAPPPKDLSVRLIGISFLLYFAVGAVLLLRLILGLASSIRLWADAKPIDSNLDCPAGTPIRCSRRISSPVNIGSGVLLPADYEQWDNEKLRVVLAHEYSHIRQRDFYLQLLTGLYTAVSWFSPLGWWLKRKLSELGEAISDHAALEAANSPAAYAQLLLEFAAMPRPTLYGVAMAHSTNLNQRIERLLNESSFRRTFAGRRHAVIALVLPAMLIAATTLVHVQAAAATSQAGSSRSDASQTVTPSPDATPVQPAITGQSHPDSDQVTGTASAQTQRIVAQEPTPAPAPSAVPSPEAAPVPSALPSPATGSQESMPAIPAIPRVSPFDVQVHIPPIPPMSAMVAFEGQASCFGNGDSYAIVGDSETKTRFCGNWGAEGAAEVEKARSIAHGHFLLLRHEGKYFVVDDPDVVHQLEDMNRTVEARAEQMRAAGKELHDAGQEAREQALKEREAAAKIPAPDLSKELAELNATVASLAAKQGATVSHEELAEVEHEVQAIQRRLIDSEVKAYVSIDMSRFNAEQDKFNAEMGLLGAEMGRLSHENDENIRSIIDESLKNGKARPVN
jgi:beta-lactamase regulating signal transducer with metallopeptidase domain